MAAGETILSNDIFTKGILPFLLVFTIIFAILQRTKILGEDKRQIDAIVSLSVALLLVAFAWPTGIITKLVPFLAVAAVVIFIFLLLYGFVASDKKEGLQLSKGIKIAAGIIILVALVIAVLWATDSLLFITNIFSSSNNIWANALLIAAIIGVMAVALSTSGKSETK